MGISTNDSTLPRCHWCGDDPLYRAYHDTEWGVPLYDDNKLFEFLILEGFQAGLSWITILRKREAFRHAFKDFDPNKVARFGDKKLAELMNNKAIVRNKRKLEAAIHNAKVFLAIQEAYGSFSAYNWQFVDGDPITNHWQTHDEIPVYTDMAEAFSNDLKAHGFKFVGPTVVYSHMQATGMVNDHLVGCFRHGAISECAL